MGAGVVCFGELLLRLNAPGRELLLQTRQLRGPYRRCRSQRGGLAGALRPRRLHGQCRAGQSPLGTACIGELRRHGVRTDTSTAARAGWACISWPRAPATVPREIVYDRRGFGVRAGRRRAHRLGRSARGCASGCTSPESRRRWGPRGRGRAACRRGSRESKGCSSPSIATTARSSGRAGAAIPPAGCASWWTSRTWFRG